MRSVDRFTCEETFRRLDDYLDRELSPREMAIVHEHLETCAICAREFAFEARLLGDVRRKLRRVDVPADLVARILRQIDAADPPA
jgi:anti-sigma factor (TIGR02949 family)